jgi:hypothetical protein
MSNYNKKRDEGELLPSPNCFWRPLDVKSREDLWKKK